MRSSQKRENYENIFILQCKYERSSKIFNQEVTGRRAFNQVAISHCRYKKRYQILKPK